MRGCAKLPPAADEINSPTLNLCHVLPVQRDEGQWRRPRTRSGAEEVSMATTSVVAMDARCPLCGSPILSFGQGGRVVAEDLHAVPLHRGGGIGEGYMVC